MNESSTYLLVYLLVIIFLPIIVNPSLIRLLLIVNSSRYTTFAMIFLLQTFIPFIGFGAMIVLLFTSFSKNLFPWNDEKVLKKLVGLK